MIKSNDPNQNGQSPAESLQQRLNQPEVAAGLNRLLDHIDSVSFAVEALDGFVARSETIIESVTETVGDLRKVDPGRFQELVHQAPELIETGTKLAHSTKGIDFEELERSRVVQRITEPETLKQLNALLDRLPLIAFMAESLEGFLRRGETITDNVAGLVGELKHADVEIDLEQIKGLISSLPKLQKAGEQILNSKLMGDNVEKVIQAGVNMIEAGMLDQDVVQALGDVGRKSVDTYHEVNEKPVPPVGGLWGMMRAARDPDVQKTVSFFVAFSKAFAKHLK